ncbi:GntR family transcriptional regulator [Actinoplanes sp. N902-109]|uniref:GntR family transcriptional regulator n=1 Tax=Actinoplanes sp. (strain N902-109) TaxID=649831 RepID=UPI000329496B|nr:GntR family transcriptional regulator [Actinoplanes sp. N902-109]AGL20435.1 GntR family transcriptional regulator [Actinoplanes sp. N902-109]
MLDDRSPIYLQIADSIKVDILRRTLAADEQVMSTNQFAATFQMNPATVAKAYARLVDEGLLYKKRGVGMFVTKDAYEKLRRQRQERFYADVVGPMLAEARMIGISGRDIIKYIERGDP